MSNIKNKILPIATIFIVVIIFAFIALKQKGVQKINNPVQQVAENIQEKAQEAFTGSLKMAVEKGIPMKCTYKQGEIEYEGYVKGKMWRGKMVSPTSKDVAEVILKDNCMWSWNSADKTKQGAKICFNKTENKEGESKDVWDESGVDNPDITYTCLPANISDSQFEPPADIDFIDLNQLNPNQFNINQ